MDTDFSRLYSQLDLSPDASLDDLKRAYRRRVGQLHPDRHVDGPDTAQRQDDFAQLVSLYGLAMRFHRRHGRLPGEASTSSPLEAGDEPSPQDWPGHVAPSVAPSNPQPVGAGSARPWLLATALVAALLLAYANAPKQQAPVPAATLPIAPAAAAVETAQAAAPEEPRLLSLGMDMRTALDIQGRPSHQRGGTWEYGPSWIRFEEGRLVQWYSSPLYRLKVSAPSALDEGASAR